MKLLRHGKTKDVFILEDGNVLLRFKDTVTGNADGSRDPGGNLVVGAEEGVGRNALAVSKYYFDILNRMNIPTHFVSANLEKGEMTVKSARLFGSGLEFVLRFKATGSFFRRFGAFCTDGQVLNPPVFEVTLKDDSRDDPPATQEILAALGLMTKEAFEDIKMQTLAIGRVMHDDLAKKGLDLIDIKFEFALDENGKVMLVDEISAGNMRVYKDGKKLDYKTLSGLILK